MMCSEPKHTFENIGCMILIILLLIGFGGCIVHCAKTTAFAEDTEDIYYPSLEDYEEIVEEVESQDYPHEKIPPAPLQPEHDYEPIDQDTGLEE